MVAVFDGPGNFRSWAVWVWFGLSFFAVLRLDFQALTLLNQIIMHLTVECQCLESENRPRVCPRQGPGSEYANFSHDGPIRKHAHNPNGVQCMNCHQWSHDRDHCYREGGGMAGQGPRAKAAVVAVVKGGKQLTKPELAAFFDALGDDGLSCASIAEELVVNSLSTLLDSGATSHLVKQ